MQKILEDIRKLCTPAYIYLVISAIAIVLIAFQNVGNTSEYCVGELSCKVPSTTGMFIVKIITVAFWTIVLRVQVPFLVPSHRAFCGRCIRTFCPDEDGPTKGRHELRSGRVDAQ
jgi:hypothetical protein